MGLELAENSDFDPQGAMISQEEMHDREERFIGGRGILDHKKRILLRDALSFAECLECGGYNPKKRAPGKQRAIETISKWNARKSEKIRLDAETIQAVVDFTYGEGSIKWLRR